MRADGETAAGGEHYLSRSVLLVSLGISMAVIGVVWDPTMGRVLAAKVAEGGLGTPLTISWRRYEARSALRSWE